jgi:hypothetical protein
MYGRFLEDESCIQLVCILFLSPFSDGTTVRNSGFHHELKSQSQNVPITSIVYSRTGGTTQNSEHSAKIIRFSVYCMNSLIAVTQTTIT